MALQLATLAALDAGPSASGASVYWTGNIGGVTDGYLSNTNNYLGSVSVPGSADTLIFVATNGPITSVTPINWVTNDLNGVVLGSLLLNTNAGIHQTILTGNAIQLNGVGGVAVQTGAGGVNHTIATPIILGATNLQWTIAGAARTLNISNTVSELNAGSRFVKLGAGTVSFAGSNSFSGGLTIGAGAVITRGLNGLGVVPTSYTSNFVALYNGGALSFRTNEPPAAPGSPSGNIVIDANSGITLGLPGGNANQRNSSGEIEIPAGNLTINSVIAAAGATNRLFKTGNGTLLLRAEANDFGGGIRVVDGTLNINREAQLGRAPSVLQADHIALGSPGQAATLVLAGSFDLGPTRGISLGFTNNNSSFNNRIQVTAGNTNRVLAPIASHPTADGLYSSTNHLVKLGAGTLVLAATNTYSGTTTVSAGTLAVDGTTGVGDTLLDGTGNLAGAGLVQGSLFASGTNVIAPGNGIGTLTVEDDAWFVAGTTLSIEITSDVSVDKFNVGGVLSLGGASLQLSAVDGFAPLGNETWIIASAAGGVNGFFAQGESITLGGLDYSIVYGPNDVAITAVPEPQTLSLAFLGAGLFAVYRFRRRNRQLPRAVSPPHGRRAPATVDEPVSVEAFRILSINQ
jgi:fibronectin-binding autotransporter adhesin